MSNLLKAAIADAKAVRATALANAKAALEEAFQPKMQEMLARKLRQEMEDEVEMDVQPEDDVMPSVEDDFAVEDEVAVEEPAPVMEPEGDEVEEHKLPLGYGHPDSVHQAAELTEEESYSLDTAPEGHETDDAHDGDPAPKTYHKNNGGTPGEPSEKVASKTYIDREVASIDADPQGGDVTKTYHKDNGGTPELKEEEVFEIDEQTLDEILKELEDEVKNDGVEEVKVASSAETNEPEVEGIVPEIGPTGYPVNEESDGLDEELDLSELMEGDDEEPIEEEKHDDEVMQENISLKAELEEYRNAVKYLRDRINEVNLLNAKLLYTNKLFKSNALTNEQKIRVIESFDRTKSVREAKLIYATLSESLNVGAKANKPVIASSKKRVAVKSITEGLASKPVASTKPTKPVVLTEGAEMANRFKKLAGIK